MLEHVGTRLSSLILAVKVVLALLHTVSQRQEETVALHPISCLISPGHGSQVFFLQLVASPMRSPCCRHPSLSHLHLPPAEFGPLRALRDGSIAWTPCAQKTGSRPCGPVSADCTDRNKFRVTCPCASDQPLCGSSAQVSLGNRVDFRECRSNQGGGDSSMIPISWHRVDFPHSFHMHHISGREDGDGGTLR